MTEYEGALNELDNSQLKPIRDIVYESLRTSILKGDLKAWERIVEKDYADRFNISRTPVREAIRKLEIEGFIEYIPRRGVVVKAFDAKEIIEIFAIRMSLECLAVKAAINNIDEAEIGCLVAIVEEMEKAEVRGNIIELYRLCTEFNEVLLKASKMPRLINIINTMQDYLERFRKITLAQRVRRTNAINEHRAILQAILNKEERKAQQLVAKHLEGAQKSLLKTLRIKQ